MKKFYIRFSIACALVLLVGATALAVSGSVRNLTQKDAENVKVELLSAEGEAPVFKVTRTNAQDGKKYLLVIRNGAENAELTEDNLFYMGVETAKGNVVTFSNAYPKDMGDGPYRVYMSDYGDNTLKQVATFDVGQLGGDTNDENQTTTVHSGDFNGSGGKPNAADVADMITLIINGYGNKATPAQLEAADFDGDGLITASDVASVITVIVG